tara:strand:+ start:101934 stop:102074 length:141 start_codon:yes stop_codon:yes gene_type:complete
MKKVIYGLLLLTIATASFTSCREKTTGEKIEDGVEEVGDEIEDAVD